MSVQIDTSELQLESKRETAGRLGVSERTLERLVGRGEFPKGIRIGERPFWNKQDTLAWIQAKFDAAEQTR